MAVITARPTSLRSTHGKERMPMAGRDQSRDQADRLTAFAGLTDSRLARAYRLAAVILRDHADAQDAVHDAAVIAWTRFDELRDRNRFDAWFDRILVNVCRQRLRRPTVRQLVMDGDAGPVLGDGTSRRAEQDALRRALDRLKPEHRLVIVLRHLEGHSIEAIAARTGEPEGTVKSRLHYALRELRAAYDAVERRTENQS
jgi:RNA polymerase sigma-70 factor, ECF subfamily